MSKLKRKNYDEVSVTRALSKKRGCDISGRTIHINPDQNDLGNSSLGKIDYLKKVHKYVVVFDKENHYQKKQHNNVANAELGKKITRDKPVPMNAKLNMAGMIKQVMTKVAKSA